MKLEQAKLWADRLVTLLSPFCARLEVAGSIRRGRAWVNDIDLVLELELGQMEGLMRCVERYWQVLRSGGMVVSLQKFPGGLIEGEVRADLFIARARARDLLEVTPSNWGSVLLCRTGSKEHNIYLCERAKALGLRWNPSEGVYRGRELVASETEGEIFAALELPWIEPGKRERRGDGQRGNDE